MTISIHDKYGNPRRQAASADKISGLTPNQVEEMSSRIESFMPRLASKMTTNNRSMFNDILPEGATLSPRTAQSLGTSNPNGGRTMTTVQMPYQPEFATPDRQQYPVHRILANRYWRMFYKLDPVIGNCVDLYSELPWSNFELTGDGIEGEIRAGYEHQCRETALLAMLPYFVKEFLVVGEVVPHCSFSDDDGLFTHIALHNPDQLEIIDAPFIKMDPIMEFIPDDKLRGVLSSNAPALQKLREKMPPELINKLMSRMNIPLSPINATFIPRKLHPYDTRGTSILSRLWRILMYEDAIFNASIQTARRAAGPLKVAKLGSAQTGWIPPPDQERRLLELLTQAEIDPQAWLVYHYGIAFELVGNTERVMSINKEWDIIERVKLIALGISKAFMHGEVTYASSATGLQVFLQRLKAMRMMFEQKWIYPKFFRPVAEINGWIKPKPAEVAHRFRVKRSAQELQEQNAYIIPKIVWDKNLDPSINSNLIQAMTSLENLGVKFSKTSKMASVGFSYEEETKKIHKELDFEKTFLPKLNLQDDKKEKGPGGGGGGPMGGGDDGPPPGGPDEGRAEDSPNSGGPQLASPPGGGADMPTPPGANPPGPPKPPGASIQLTGDGKNIKDSKTPKGEQDEKVIEPGKSSNSDLKSEIWIDNTFDNWTADEAADVIDLLGGKGIDDDPWRMLSKNEQFVQATAAGDVDTAWDMLVKHLEDNGYPPKDIASLHKILTIEGVIQSSPSSLASELENSLDDTAASLDDEAFASAVANIIKTSGQSKIMNDTFLSGVDTSSHENLRSDISDLLGK